MKNPSYLIVLLLAFSVLLSSCRKDYPVIVDLAIDLWIRDGNGNNLFNTNTINHFEKDSVRVFYLENGIRKEFNNPLMGAPRNFLIMENTSNGEYGMRLLPYNGPDVEGTIKTTTFIQWNSVDQDTVECEINKIRFSEICTKVWYNGKLKYDDATAHSINWGNAIVWRFFEVRK
jgi:hypothetical protein